MHECTNQVVKQSMAAAMPPTEPLISESYDTSTQLQSDHLMSLLTTNRQGTFDMSDTVMTDGLRLASDCNAITHCSHAVCNMKRTRQPQQPHTMIYARGDNCTRARSRATAVSALRLWS
jgi:hypothetical protein